MFPKVLRTMANLYDCSVTRYTLFYIAGSGSTLMMNTTNDQVISILTLAGYTSYDKNLILEDAFNQNMLGSFLLVRSSLCFSY
jgi:hypothetical protein